MKTVKNTDMLCEGVECTSCNKLFIIDYKTSPRLISPLFEIIIIYKIKVTDQLNGCGVGRGGG